VLTPVRLDKFLPVSGRTDHALAQRAEARGNGT
jgi:hypothetical protein